MSFVDFVVSESWWYSNTRMCFYE